MNLLQGLLKQAQQHPQEVAVLFIENKQMFQLTWKQVSNRIEHYGKALKSLGIKKGDRVALFAHTSKEWGFLDLAIMSLGGVTVPIYPSSHSEEVDYILENSGAEIVLVENESLWRVIAARKTKNQIVAIQRFNGPDIPHQFLADLVSESQHVDLELTRQQINETDLATIVYTSGTSGTPKGVELTHTQVNSSVQEVFPLLGTTIHDRTLTFLPFSHILGRMELWGHYQFGYTLGYAQSIDTIKKDLMMIKPTVIVGVPRIFEKIYYGVLAQIEVSQLKRKIFEVAMSIGERSYNYHRQHQAPPLWQSLQYFAANQLVYSKIKDKLGGCLRFAVSGGAALDSEIALFFENCGIPILQGYGLTETTGPIFVNTLFARKNGSVGRPIGDVEVRYADDGEILIRSQKVMERYHDLEAETRDAFNQEGFFKTGDIGHQDEEQYLFITDRKKDLLKTAGGKFIAPQKIQTYFSKFAIIDQVHIHADGRKYAVALMSLNEDEVKRISQESGTDQNTPWSQREVVRQAVREAVAQVNSQLASYETVKGFYILDHAFSVEGGELTPSFKIKRRVVEARYKSQLDSLYL